MHLQQQQPYPQRITTAPPRPASSQRADTSATATRSNKKSGFTLTSPVVAAHEVDDEGDSDEWVSSESVSVTPQNQSSDSESGDEDDDVVQNLHPHLTLSDATHISTSPDDREPPTPTVSQVKMQLPTQVNNVKEDQRRHRLSTAPVHDEAGTGAVVNSTDRHGRGGIVTSGKSDHDADAVAVRPNHDYRHSDHHACPEEGLASTPRPRAMFDRDTDPSRNPPPDHLPNPSHSDSPVRKPPVVNPRLSEDVNDRPQRQTLSAPQSHPRITTDSSPGPRADNNPQGRDQITMTQVSEDPPVRIIPEPSYI